MTFDTKFLNLVTWSNTWQLTNVANCCTRHSL